MAVRSTSRILLGLTSGVVLSALLLEALLWLLPTFNGVFAADPNPDWPVEHYLPSKQYTYSTSWNFRNVRHGVTNDMGYVAPFDYRTNPAFAALFGDSYVQALMIRYEDSITGQLASLSQSDPSRVLNFGIAGSALPDYLGVGSLVRDRFHPEWVIVSVGDGDFVEGFSVGPGHFRWSVHDPNAISLVAEEARSPVIKIIRRSALVRYLRSNLRLTLRGVLVAEPPMATDSFEPPCNDEELSTGDSERIKKYVEQMPGAFGVPAGKIVLVQDSEALRKRLYVTQSIDHGKDCSPSRDEQALQLLMDKARHAGMNVVDTFPLFRSHFETTGERVDFLRPIGIGTRQATGSWQPRYALS